MKFFSVFIFALLILKAISANAEPPKPCTAEIGTNFENVGTFVQATSTTNFFIQPGQCLISPNRKYMAVLQAEDGNFVVYPTNSINAESNLWNSKTFGNPKAGLLVQQDGHFVIYKEGGIGKDHLGRYNADPAKNIFISNPQSASFADYFLIMRNDSGLVLSRGTPANNLGNVWASSEHPIERTFCVTLLQNNGNVVYRKSINADSSQKAKSIAQVIFSQYNQSSIPAYQASTFRVSGGGC